MPLQPVFYAERRAEPWLRLGLRLGLYTGVDSNLTGRTGSGCERASAFWEPRPTSFFPS
jgi:hypothetical protein